MAVLMGRGIFMYKGSLTFRAACKYRHSCKYMASKATVMADGVPSSSFKDKSRLLLRAQQTVL